MATGLGIRIHLDENVDVRLADALNQRGYDATTALGQGWLHLSDEDQLRHATAMGRAIVSHDFDGMKALSWFPFVPYLSFSHGSAATSTNTVPVSNEIISSGHELT
jgi:uncharacterized protein DUF5615